MAYGSRSPTERRGSTRASRTRDWGGTGVVRGAVWHREEMTERKPPGVDFETFVDKQIREANERGAFEDLPGRGKPLPGEGAPYDELWWVKRKLSEEGVSCLPATLALRKRVEDDIAAAMRAPSVREARRLVLDVNARIETAMRTPMDGPPHGLVPYDLDEFVERWRGEYGRHAPERAVPAGSRSPKGNTVAEPKPRRGWRRRWWR